MSFLSVIAALAVCLIVYIVVRRGSKQAVHDPGREDTPQHHRCAVVRADIDRELEKLVISNVGQGVAEAIDILFVSMPEPIDRSDRLEKLPVASLRPGESCALKLTAGSPIQPPVELVLEWREPCGTVQECEQTLESFIVAETASTSDGSGTG